MCTKNLVGIFLLGSCVVFGQDYRATILGQVLDPSKAPVPNATVKATKEDTNVSRENQNH
jgi:hypothetical protein